MKQIKLDRFLGRRNPPESPVPVQSAIPKQILLKDMASFSVLAEQDGKERLSICVEMGDGRKRFLRFVSGDQIKRIAAIKPDNLSPRRVRAILPGLSEEEALFLSEAFLNLYRKKSEGGERVFV